MSTISPNKILFTHPRVAVLQARLGEGVHGGRSIKTGSPVAVKIADCVTAAVEISGLQFEIPHAVRFRDDFNHNDKVCIVMDEIFGKNIMDAFLSPTAPQKLTLCEITAITSQLFEVLEDLEDKNLVNFDIKPENLIWSRSANSLTAVDLASIRQLDESYAILPKITLEFLPPEAILGKEIDCSYNIWSTACTLFELIVGEALFERPGHGIDEQSFILQQIVEQIGPPSPDYIKTCIRGEELFDETGSLHVKWNTPQKAPWKERLKEALIQKGAQEAQITLWIELLSSMLCYDNRREIKELLANPLFNKEIRIHLIFDRMNKCMLQITRAAQTENGPDLLLDFARDKNHCIHLPKDPTDTYVVVAKQGANESKATITLTNGQRLDVTPYQAAVTPAKRALFPSQ